MNRLKRYEIVSLAGLLIALVLIVGVLASPGEPAITITSPANTTYSTAAIDLNWSTNETLDWAGYELNGAAEILPEQRGSYNI